MRFLLKSFVLGLFSTHLIVLASESSTKWTIKNNTSEELALLCKNITYKDMNIVMKTATIKPNQSEVFDWGDNYYNDGLELNSGIWNCTIKNKTKLPSEFENFSTEWGESLSLDVNEASGKLKLIKLAK
ncbi:hypothetical protein GCL60_10790 [Silvanigrella paludirubra]|uniref:Uncharacterized protein n=1 Tax=Silvanigrella paludirubra TaxID=2499159 RepID=A0A6N6VRH3_9BACT|nr:hypothetical protein [Silvanigrella paludirubra]KAB8037653.1 hypothetical protein GCL60_10790 [Silvanigrella paludirubra]